MTDRARGGRGSPRPSEKRSRAAASIARGQRVSIEKSELTPLRVVQMYNDDHWGKHQRDLLEKLVANPLRRHHPGKTEIFTHDDMRKRYDGYFAKHRAMRAAARHYVCEGPYVTLVWDFALEANDGRVTNISSIEIFKVVDGKITDVWNPNPVAEQYPAGPWPPFET